MRAIPKHYSLVAEHPASYEIHDSRDDRRFHVAKSGLDLDMHGKLSQIQRFDDGGPVQPVGISEGADEAVGNPQAGPIPPPAPPVLPVMPDTAATGVPAFTGAGEAPLAMPQTDQIPTAQSAPAPVPGDGAPRSDQGQNPIDSFAAKNAAGLDNMEKSVKGALGAEQKAQGDIARAWGDYAKQADQLRSPEQIMKDSRIADDKAREAFESKKIDPDHYWSTKSTGQKIAASLGMILGGMGSATTGGPNYAMQTINSAIDRDLEAQRADQSKSMNLWKMNREATKNDLEANLHTRNQLLTAVEAKTKMFAASMGGAEAQLKFAPLLMDIQRQKNENYIRMGLAKGGMSEMDPAQLVPMMVKNPEQQKQVYEEIGRAQNVANNKEKILKAFDDSSRENTVMRTGAGYVRTPGSVMALHQLMLPNFKQIDGTVRQAAMDESFHNLTPSPGDTAAKVAARRQALSDWMESETAAPIAKGNGLDLSRFKSTMSNSPPPVQTQKMNGVTYVKVPGGWKRAG